MLSAYRLGAFLLLTCFGVAFQELPARAQGGLAATHEQHRVKYMPAATQWMELPLDHFSSGSQLFRARYFINKQYADPANPILFYEIGGEGPVNGLRDDYVSTLAQKYRATVVTMEHRFYGESVPGDSKEDGLTNLLAYHTVEQSLADIKYAIQQLATPGSKVFTFGGSYPGALSAWFRLQYPHVTNGSLASSGVVNNILDFPDFDDQVALAVGGPCATAIQATTHAYEAAFAAGKGTEAKLLFGVGALALSEPDFYYMTADSAAMAVQYGHKADLCEMYARLGPSPSPDTLMQSFASFTNSFWGNDFGSNCFYSTDCLKHHPDHWQPTSRSWRWQKCSQLAYLQTAPTGFSLRSSSLSLKVLLQQCADVFNGTQPDTQPIQKIFGGANPQGTNIFFSDFSDDPWLRASVRQDRSPTMPYELVQCDGCGHCMDLGRPDSKDPQPLRDGRARFETYLEAWLR